jgi:hypothetical protein
VIRDNIANTIKGAGALQEALDCIGATEPNGDGKTDHALAKIIVDNELALRDLVRYSLNALATEA